ncbi:hypothetical protein D5R81_17450 [Parashewanella spongiae]|uniref:Uncharacterized protein n=1 Tax=Parashewanella spongiae TaxID=342950 RepID=A0A3A6TF67_9GAMM|nr:hypothetical protein [Parashewanella spongiae]MCL1079888.1 hypothetical protein [Parashewanella spongiae]RJY06683.1 hypothetical protein D5R81_17450 [Parashewanella spongiae]
MNSLPPLHMYESFKLSDSEPDTVNANMKLSHFLKSQNTHEIFSAEDFDQSVESEIDKLLSTELNHIPINRRMFSSLYKIALLSNRLYKNLIIKTPSNLDLSDLHAKPRSCEFNTEVFKNKFESNLHEISNLRRLLTAVRQGVIFQGAEPYGLLGNKALDGLIAYLKQFHEQAHNIYTIVECDKSEVKIQTGCCIGVHFSENEDIGDGVLFFSKSFRDISKIGFYNTSLGFHLVDESKLDELIESWIGHDREGYSISILPLQESLVNTHSSRKIVQLRPDELKLVSDLHVSLKAYCHFSGKDKPTLLEINELRTDVGDKEIKKMHLSDIFSKFKERGVQPN